MTELHEQPDLEPEGPPTTSSLTAQKAASSRKSLSEVHRALTDADLRSAAVNKLLLDDLDRLEREVSEIPGLRHTCHEAQIEARVLAERFKSKVSIEVIHSGCIAIGGAIVGFAPSFWAHEPATSVMASVLGLILLGVGIAAKAVKL